MMGSLPGFLNMFLLMAGIPMNCSLISKGIIHNPSLSLDFTYNLFEELNIPIIKNRRDKLTFIMIQLRILTVSCNRGLNRCISDYLPCSTHSINNMMFIIHAALIDLLCSKSSRNYSCSSISRYTGKLYLTSKPALFDSMLLTISIYFFLYIPFIHLLRSSLTVPVCLNTKSSEYPVQ